MEHIREYYYRLHIHGILERRRSSLFGDALLWTSQWDDSTIRSHLRSHGAVFTHLKMETVR